MAVHEISNLEALAFVLGVLLFAYAFLRLVPSSVKPAPLRFSAAEITAYDRELPKYFLVATLALLTGAFHIVIKNLPGFWQWLWEAGYGGHLFRDLSNSHIIIVGGGTVLLTGVTWYLLPRFVNRPLYSTSLAGASFWLTVAGVFGFYLAWLVLGLVEGEMVRQGWAYQVAKDALGNWHRLPTALTSSVMGLGYWSYVLNVFLTVLTARRVPEKPHGHLTKFALVSAGALFVGTVQGVVQVLPANADWIHEAGKFGQYVDPISHAHVNLVTGMMVSLAAFFIYFAPRMGGQTVSRRQSNLLFWLLVGGSLMFYLSFLFLGLILGGAWDPGTVGGASLKALLGRWRAVILAVAGTVMLFGFWFYFYTIWRGLRLKSVLRQASQATPAGFWLVSSVALFVGTLHGMLQVVPSVARIITVPEEVPNIHAQINMIGGVLLALIGVIYLLLPEVAGRAVERRLARRSLYGIAAGIGVYYLTTVAVGLTRYVYLSRGLDNVAAAAKLQWVAPFLLLLTALPLLFGFISFAQAVWGATAAFRARWRRELGTSLERWNGPRPAWMSRFPVRNFVTVELLTTFGGFPGLGWLLAGYAVPGIPMLLAGPGIAWALLPLLISPYGDGPLAPYGLWAPLTYLIVSSILSATALWFVLYRRQEPRQA